MNHTSMRQSMLFTVSLLLIICGLACNDRGADPLDSTSYVVNGSLVADPNTDSVYVAIDFDKDGTNLATAEIWLDDDSLLFDVAGFNYDSVYSFTEDSVGDYLLESISLRIEDPQEFADTLTFAVPDTFSITGVVPVNHLIVGNGTATVGWYGSSRSSAYVIAVVKADDAYTGVGYSEYATTGTTAATFPPDAFVQAGTDIPDTGLYNLYVYALSGAPDSALAESFLPVPLPDQLVGNIAGESIEGTFGTIIITHGDTVRVTTIQ